MNALITRAILLGVIATGAAACGTTTSYSPTNPSPRAMQPRAPEQVYVYTTALPQVPFVEVGIIVSRQSSTMSVHRMPEILAAMRKEAARLGCDGLIINGVNNTVDNSLNDVSFNSTREGFWGVCIMYLEPGAVAASR
jgi:hypothetical protein